MKPTLTLFAALLLTPLAALAAAPLIQPFSRHEVRLTPSVWLDAQKRDGDYLLSLEPDRLLYCFRVTAGLPAPGQAYGGWEDAKAGLRGHVTGGHYLSALAMMYASTGDSRFKERGALMVAELAKCQAANPRGHVGGIPEAYFETLEKGERGHIPFYTIHKMLAGLVALYEECGNAQALEIAKKEALYLAARNEKFTHEQLLALHVAKFEAGGIVESLWDLYALTHEEKIKELALKLEQSLFLDDLANQQDTLTHRHGNTHIPLVLGAVRRFELTGEARYLELAKYFWERVVVARGWATGGTTGPGEGWGEAGKLAGIMSLTTHETCKTYNLLRLSRKLFMHTGDPRYADYYSRAHLNGILGTEGPEPGQLEYYVPMATGYHRWYGFPDRSMWCCYGTGMENFSKLGDSVFFHTADALIINQFIPCVLDWKEKKLQLAIETKYPEEETVNFVMKSGAGKLTLRILQPSWAGQGVAVSVNGKAAPVKVDNGFIVVDGSWKAGDKVAVKFPMSLRTIPLPDDAQQVAIAYGPVVLAGIVDRPQERFFQIGNGAGEPQPDSEKMKKAYYFIADSPDNLLWLKPIAGKPLHFQAEGQPFNLSFQPFYAVTSERYGIYWPILAKGSDRQRGMDLENQTLDLLRAMDAYKAGKPTSPIEQGFAKFSADKTVAAYHERLRLGMAKVFKTAGQDAKSAETLKPLAAPFIGFKRAAAIMAILGDEAETHGVRPLVMDDYDKYGDAAAERDVVDGVPVVKTMDARARYVYFGFTAKGKAALTRKNVRLTMKYRSDSAPVLHYDSVTAPYAPVKPAKIETVDGWKIATFDCPAALFAGRQNLHASLRVAACDGAILTIADLKAETQAPSRLLADRLDPMAIRVPDKVTPKAYAFDLHQVTLLEGPFKHAQEIQRQYLLETKLDPLLYPFRREAGLPNPAKGSDYLGWGTTGHAMGHYLSACAMIYRNTGDVELKKSADEAVAKLAECQAAMKNGYLGGMPEKSILLLEKLIDDRAFQVGPAWYVQHKIYAGLLDMYLLTGNRQALDVLEKTIDWVIQNTNQLNEQQMQEMLGVEHGGMNEVLANLYSVTGKEKHLRLAQRFNQHKVIDPMAEHQDIFDGMHANTQFPKFIGALRQYQLIGDEKLGKAARAFWETVASERSYVTGGNSLGEAFSPKAHLSEYVHRDTTETCNEYNMLKLTRGLFIIEPQVRYADYYERTLWNQILSTVHPKTGGQLYFQQLESGRSKGGWGLFSKGGSSCSCCCGTGLESVAKFADSIYFNDGAEGLFVNLFIASELNWKARGVQVRQETRYPDEGTTRLVFSCPAPVGLTVHLRHPWWATQSFEIRINGQKQAITSVPGSYVPLQRQWKNGDTLEVLMPMTLHLDGFKDNPKRAAVMYGPLVMAGMTPPGNRFSALIGENEAMFKEFKALEGKSLEFSAPAAICRTSLDAVAAEPVVFKPLFRVIDETYAVYWDCLSSQEFAALPAVFQEEIARHKELEPKTVDLVLSFVNAKGFRENGRETMQGYLLGRGVLPRTIEQVSEEAHGIKVTIGAPGWLGKSGVDPDDMYPNLFRFPGDLAYRTRYLPGGGGYSYQMKVEPGARQKCQIRLWHPDTNEHGRSTKGVGTFEVLVDDQLIGTCKVDDLAFNTFVDVSYPIPAALTAGKSTVALSLRAKKHIRGIYEVRILKN